MSYCHGMPKNLKQGYHMTTDGELFSDMIYSNNILPNVLLKVELSKSILFKL